MRLGVPLFEKFDTPDAWIAILKKLKCSAAYTPITDAAQPDDVVKAYADAARKAGIVIAEVGAWSNLIAPDETGRNANIEKNIRQLALADRIGAVCCVNIVGSRGQQWNGPHPDNITPATFDLIVETLRRIIDGAQPVHASYTLEMMGWGLPDSAESYLDILKAVDRKALGVHLDPVNLINSPRRFYENTKLLEHTIRTLAPHIRSVHAKDVTLGGKHLIHLDECRPGTGALDYPVFLRELSKLPRDLPVMMEHLKTAEEYAAGADFIRATAGRIGVEIL